MCRYPPFVCLHWTIAEVPWSYSLDPLQSCVQRAVRDEAQLVSPRVGRIERPLSPWPLDHVARRLPMHLEGRQCPERLRPRVHVVDVRHREVDRFVCGPWTDAAL